MYEILFSQFEEIWVKQTRRFEIQNSWFHLPGKSKENALKYFKSSKDSVTPALHAVHNSEIEQFIILTLIQLKLEIQTKSLSATIHNCLRKKLFLSTIAIGPEMSCMYLTSCFFACKLTPNWRIYRQNFEL